MKILKNEKTNTKFFLKNPNARSNGRKKDGNLSWYNHAKSLVKLYEKIFKNHSIIIMRGGRGSRMGRLILKFQTAYEINNKPILEYKINNFLTKI